MYGETYNETGGLNNKQVRHLLLQFTNVPGMCKDLIFFLYDQHARHSNIHGMSAKVKGNPAAFKTFAETMLTQEFHRNLKEAIEDPKSNAAKGILHQVLPVLEFVGKNTRGGPLHANQVKSHIYAMATHFGSGSGFFTIAPDDINNPKSFRFAQHTINNYDYPATVENDQELLHEMLHHSTTEGEGNIPFPLGYTARAKAAAENPVATTLEYMSLIDHLLEILIGVERNENKKRTKYFMQGRKGVFGHI